MKSIVRIIVTRNNTVLISFCVLIIASVLMTGLLRFEQDISSVLPRNNRTVKVLMHALQTSDAQDKLYILLLGQEDNQLIPAGDALVKKLREMRLGTAPAFDHVTAQKNEAVTSSEFTELLTVFHENPEYFLVAQDLPRLSSLVGSPVALEQELKKTLAMLAVPGSSQFADVLVQDPFNTRQFLTEKMSVLLQGMSFAPGPYLLSMDKQALLVIAAPSAAAMPPRASRQLLQQLEILQNSHPGIRIKITGGYAIAAQQEALVKTDMITCLVASVLAIALLFFLVYRNVVVLLFVFIPLGVGLQLALGVMAMVWNHTHMLALAFAAVVLGLGIDFTIHIYDRYVSERRGGRDIAEALDLALHQTGPAVFACGATTIATFFVLIFIDNPLISQIGWLVNLGILFCLITTLWALPAFLVWLDTRSLLRFERASPQLGMGALGRISTKHPRIVLAVAVCILLIALAGTTRIRFEDDLLSLRPKGLDAFEVQQELVRAFSAGQEYVLVAWPAGTQAGLWETGRTLDTKFTELKNRGMLSSYVSLTQIASQIPIRMQTVNRKAVNEIFARYGLQKEDFSSTVMFIESLSGQQPKDLHAEGTLTMLPGILQRFFINDKDHTEGIAWIQIASGVDAELIQHELACAVPDLIIINKQLATRNIGNEVHGQFWFTMGLSIALTLGILALFFRRASSFLLVLLPLGFGLCVTAGIIGLSDMRINLFNYIVLPIVIGAGLDYGIIIFCRYRETHDIQTTLRDAGRSVLITVLTTVLGFGSLSLANYHVLAGMGIMVTTGVLLCFIFAITVLPALLSLIDQKNDNAPDSLITNTKRTYG